MVTKTVVIFLAACLAGQVLSAPQPTSNNLVDIALELAAKSLKSLTEAIDANIELVRNADDQFDKEGDNIEKQITDAIEASVKAVKEKIESALDGMEANTNDEGIRVINCAKTALTTIEANTDKGTEACSSCVKDVFHQYALDLEAVLLDIEKKNVEIKGYEEDITSCSSATSITTCVSDDLLKIYTAIGSLSEYVKEDYDKVLVDIDNLSKAYSTCIEPNVEQSEKDNEQAFMEFASCVSQNA